MSQNWWFRMIVTPDAGRGITVLGATEPLIGASPATRRLTKFVPVASELLAVAEAVELDCERTKSAEMRQPVALRMMHTLATSA